MRRFFHIPQKVRMVGRRFGLPDGTVIPLTAFLMVIIVGFAAFGVDWGQMHETRRQLQNTVDAAALAGAKELPFNQAKAYDVAATYVQLNGFSEAADISFEYRFTDPSIGPDTIIVREQHNVNTFFAGVLGRPSSLVSAQATGVKGSIGVILDCILPLAVLDGAPGTPGEDGAPFKFWPYEYVMKESAQGDWAGNRGGVNLYDPPSEFFPAVSGRCPPGQKVVVDDFYRTHTGDWGQNFFAMIYERVGAEPIPWKSLDDYAYLSPPPPQPGGKWYPRPEYGTSDLTQVSKRFVLVPIFDYDDYTDCNGSCDLQLKGVTMFFMTFVGCEEEDGGETPLYDKPDGECSPGKGILRGSYIKVVEWGGMTAWNPYGTEVVRLWR